MTARKEIRPGDRLHKGKSGHDLFFWKTEYTRRKFSLDYELGSKQRNSLLKAWAILTQRMEFAPYQAFAPEKKQLTIKVAVATFHNIVVENPKSLCYHPLLETYSPSLLLPLTIDCSMQLAEIRDISFKYGYFVSDLWDFTDSKLIAEMIINNEPLPEVQITFPRENDDANWNCRFNYCDMHGKQFFEKEASDYFYYYGHVLGAKQSSLTDIAKWLRDLKRDRDQMAPAEGNLRDATIQICVHRETPNSQLDDIKAFIQHAVKKYRMDYLLTDKETDYRDYEALWWVVYGVDYEQLPGRVRAFGLWLWDLVEISGQTLKEAINTIFSTKTGQLLGRGDLYATDEKQAHRDLAHARKCINAMSVFNLTG